MEYDYKYDNIKNDSVKSDWRPLFRQLVVSSGIWVVYFSMGLCMGAPTVFIPQLRKEANSTEAVSDEMASWLSSVFGYSALPWVIILSVLINAIGRKYTSIIMSVSTVGMFVVFYCSQSATHLLIAEIITGVTHASTMTVTVIVIGEYTSPKYRGIFLTLKSACLLWGIWVSNAIGTFFYWRYIPLFGFLCSLYTLSVFYWCESPHWLAARGRYHDCRKAHRWLKGSGAESERELEKLIKNHHHLKSREEVKSLSFVKSLMSREFYVPLSLSLLAVTLYHFSGKFVCSIYSIEIIKRITNNEGTAYSGMLILDGVTVFSTYIGCILSKILRRRVLLLTTTFLGITFLFIISLYLYLIKLSMITENNTLTVLFLSVFSICISCGPIILCTSLYGELIPLKFKSISVIIISLTFFSLHSTILKISPMMFKSIGMHGAFLFYGISSSVIAILIFKYLPETHNKTLLEIEECFKKR